MLTKNQTKLILGLKKKKQRQQKGLFVAEGVKVVQEFLDSDYELVEIFSTSQAYVDYQDKLTLIDKKTLSKISSLSTPNIVLAIFKIPKPRDVDLSSLILALDAVNNPGNLGTIIRLCDWFGVKDLVCSKNTVDSYNPKVVQAAMGSHPRVNICYLDLESFLESKPKAIGTFMNGATSIYQTVLPISGVVVLGNEANGISEAVSTQLKIRLSIPRYGALKQTESLNVAVAAAILLSEFKRQSIEM